MSASIRAYTFIYIQYAKILFACDQTKVIYHASTTVYIHIHMVHAVYCGINVYLNSIL